MTASPLSRAGLAVAAAGVLLLVGPGAAAGTACRAVQGTYVEHLVTGPDCGSPVGLCIAGTYRGAVRGPFDTTVTSLTSTRTGQVQLFTSASTVTASVAGRSGTLLINNAGAFSNADGLIVDLQTIVRGTGELDGASGSLRAGGTFTAADGGSSRWTGVICLP